MAMAEHACSGTRHRHVVWWLSAQSGADSSASDRRLAVRAAAIAAFIARTPAAAPSGCAHTAPTTARKSAPARTSGAQLAAVMPPIATQGSSNMPLHHSRISGAGRCCVSLVEVGKKAPKAT